MTLCLGVMTTKPQAKAIVKAFHGSSRLTCTRHLCENIQRYLADNLGYACTDRQCIIAKIFGEQGLSRAADAISFEIRQSQVEETIRTIAPDFLTYFSGYVVPLLRMNLDTKEKTGLPNSDQPWTNNNCESINHVLKQATEWKTRSMVDLIDILHRVVRAQYDDIKRAMVELCNFQLAPSFQRFAINPCVWDSKSPQQQKLLFERLLKYSPAMKTNTVLSSDGHSGVICPPSGSKKPEQRK